MSTLNELIAEQQGVPIEQLSISSSETVKDVAKVQNVAAPISEPIDAPSVVLSDEDLAKKYRSDADRLSKEAAALRRMAEELVPSKKKKDTSHSQSTPAD